MKTTIVAAGIVVLLIGLGLWFFATSTPVPTSTSTTTTTASVIPSTNRNIDANGDWSHGMNLQGGEAVTGTATIQNFNKSAGPAFFYIMNESVFIDWGGCAPCTEPSSAVGHLAQGSLVNSTMPTSGTLAFSYTAPTTGAYYVVFDNEAYGQSAQATVSATGVASSAVTTSSPYAGGYLPLIGAAIAVVGVIIAAMSVMMKGKPKMAPPAAPAPTQSS
ncbi:MAG: hypothetical protein JRM80_05815 [Nitrososphaerota archaeon]|nr:hypothetical protein [Nitrososphaerota archaeon]